MNVSTLMVWIPAPSSYCESSPNIFYHLALLLTTCMIGKCCMGSSSASGPFCILKNATCCSETFCEPRETCCGNYCCRSVRFSLFPFLHFPIPLRLLPNMRPTQSGYHVLHRPQKPRLLPTWPILLLSHNCNLHRAFLT